MGKKTSKNVICLSGPPGAGKTVIGQKVAGNLNIEFFDLDELTAEKEGVDTTREIIVESREHFWKVENECLKELFHEKKKFVLALGGGVVISHNTFSEENKKILMKAFNICLLPSPEIIESTEILWSRHKNGKRALPYNDKEGLIEYLEKTTPQYTSQADKIIYTKDNAIEEIAEKIIEFVK